MKTVRVLLAGAWITASEFFRNQILLISNWNEHFSKLGLKFITKPINGIFWALWSFMFAGILYWILRGLSKTQTMILAWIIAFPMMWLTLFNLQVLPVSILLFAVPLSMLEVVVAVFIIGKQKD